MVFATKLVHVIAADAEHQRTPAAVRPSVDAQELDVGVLFDRVLDAIVIARLTTGRIVLWNRAAVKLFGYSTADAIGKSIEMLMPEPIAQLHRSGLERYMRSGHGLIVDASNPVEMPARTKNGEEIRVELMLSELQNASGERFAVAVIRDATHRKQLELANLELAQARIARSEAEAALADRNDLLDAISATLQSEPSTDELGRLTSSLADFGRLERGELTVRAVETDLVDIVHAACDSARRRAPRRHVLVHTPPNAPVRCDPVRTRRVIDELLDEAIRRSDDGGRVQVRLEAVSLQLVVLSLQSDGRDEDRPLGAGLQISRTLIRRQGGSIAAVVSPSGGLEVVMTLPGSPHPTRRRSNRSRRPIRPALVS